MNIYNYSNRIKKYVALLILVIFIVFQLSAVSFQPKQVEAQWIVWDPQVWQQNLTTMIKEEWRYWTLMFLKNVMLKKMVKSLQGKYPSVVRNWTDWLHRSGIDISLDWVYDLWGIDLCAHIRPEVITSLKAYAREPVDEPDCTLTDFLDNVEDTYDYIANGDWAVFEESIANNNTEVGIYIGGVLTIDSMKAEQKEIELFELVANEGYAGQKDENGNVTNPGIMESEQRKEGLIRLPVEYINNLDSSSGLSEMLVSWAVRIFTTQLEDTTETDTTVTGSVGNSGRIDL